MDYSIRGEMTVQFEAVNPATLEIQNNKTHKLELIEQVGDELLYEGTDLFLRLLKQ